MSVLVHDENDRHVFVNQSERSMLQFTGKDTFRVNIRDFLDLESTFHTGCVLESARQEEQVGFLDHGPGEFLNARLEGKDFLDIGRQTVQAINDLLAAFGLSEVIVRELKCDHHQDNVLRSVGFGRSDTDFRASVDMDPAVGLARDGRADGVGNSDTKGASFLTVGEGIKSITSFS